jgi:hypothetical protein
VYLWGDAKVRTEVRRSYDPSSVEISGGTEERR